MTVEKLTKADFDFILEHIVEFWGSERTLALHHPMFLHESGPTAYVIRDGDKVLAYCLGFFSQTEPAAYVHLVGVHKSARRQGLAASLHEQFEADAWAHGCADLKAITAPANTQSIAFHRIIGMELEMAKEYAGPGEDRIVMRKPLGLERTSSC